MTSKRIRHGDIEQLWERFETKNAPSRNRISVCTDVRNGKQMFQLPKEFNVAGAENLIISLPQKQIVPLKTVNVLSRKRPRLQRYKVGNTLDADFIAGNIESWVNAAVEKRVRWGELIGKLFLDGECAVIVAPTLTSWQHSPDFMDSLTQEEFERLDEETQSRYRRADDYGDPIIENEEEASPKRRKRRKKTITKSSYVRTDDTGEPMPNLEYLRDVENRSPEHRYYNELNVRGRRRKFKENRKRSEEAFEEAQKHWLSEELPFKVSVISAQDCLPIMGVDSQLEGLIVKRTFSREALIARNYVWEEDSDMLTQTGPDESGEVTLFEYWGTDADGTPYVAYSVNGTSTHFRTSLQDQSGLCDAVVDLRKEFGLRKLPVMYCWGLHYETDDLRYKGVPFLWPVLGAITGVESLASIVLAHSYSTAFGSWGIAVDPQILRDYPDLLVESGKPRTIPFAPMTNTYLPGRPYPLVHPGVGKDINNLMNMLREAAESFSPSDIAFGGGSASSGHDRALSRDYLETSMNQVLTGALEAYQFIGERVLEICSNITRLTKVSVPVYATVPVPQIRKRHYKKNDEKEILELSPSWIGPVFNLHAYYPQEAGESMAEKAQLAQLHLQGLVTFREFREKGFGDENSAATLIEIYTDQFLKADAGRAEVAQIAAEMMGADSESEKQKLIDEQRLTRGGTPLAALPPELQALHTGEVPPGVDPELFLSKLQTMLAHRAAGEAAQPSGPLGAISSPGDIGQLAVQAGAPSPASPPSMTPQGAPGPMGPAPPGVNEQAATMPGMSLPDPVASEVGGRIAGEMGTASALRDSASQGGL